MSTRSAELNWTRPIGCRRVRDRLQRRWGSSYSTEKWQQSKHTRTWSASSRRASSAVDAESRGELSGAEREQPVARRSDASRRWFSMKQSGSGSMSRWMKTPALVAEPHERRGDVARRSRAIVSPIVLRPVADPRLVRQRHGRHAAVEAVGQERREDVDQVGRVAHARRVAPVRRVDVRLDDGAVERAVREAVDDRDVQPVVVEERAEAARGCPSSELAGVARRQAQADAERARPARSAP